MDGHIELPAEAGLRLTRAPMPADLAVGRRIRDLRRAAGLTQRGISELAGVTSAQVHRYERGLARISTGRLLKIADGLGVSVETLITGTNMPPRPAPAAEDHAELDALCRAFLAIRNPEQRQALLVLARSMAASSRAAARPTE